MYLNGDPHIKIPKMSSPTTGSNFYSTSTLDSLNDSNDMKQVLIYALPLASVAIMVVLLVVVVLHRRHPVLERWSSLTRMKNTNPRFYECTGLRGDPEYEGHSDSLTSTVTINDDASPTQSERNNRLFTIT